MSLGLQRLAFAAARGLAALPSASPLAALGCSPSSVSSGVRAPAPAAQLPQSSYQAQSWKQHSGSWRRYSADELRVVQAQLAEPAFHELADEALDLLQERLEAYTEDNDIAGGDVEYASGVLTVRLGSKGTFVINKQTPNRQIWLSSPVSGPCRYDYVKGRWRYSRTGQDLLRQLETEMGQLTGKPLVLD